MSTPKVNSTEIIDLEPKQPRSIMKECVKPVWEIKLDTVKEITQETEVVIRVQKELAVQALELVVKSGKNKIRVEFI
jgi:hypothetical protein